MVYKWCTSCNSRECTNENSHRAQNYMYYRADFRLGGTYGKRVRKLFPNKKDAEAYEYVTMADHKRGTFLPVDTSKIKFEEFFKEYNELYIQRHMKGCKEEEYRLRAFQSMYTNRPLNSFTINDWNSYVSSRLENVGKTTLNRELTSLKGMFQWAIKNGYLKNNPFKEAVKFKEEVVKIRWLDDKEIEKILNACTQAKDLDLRDVLVFALNTGFRKANLEAVTVHDINNQRIEARKTKSGKSYQVPINNELNKLLQRLILSKPSGPLLNFSNFRNRFDTVIKDPTVTLHTFRHTFAAQCLKRGIPIDRVCAWLGHHSMEFTRTHYGHLSPNQEAVEINLLNLGQSSQPTNKFAPSSSETL